MCAGDPLPNEVTICELYLVVLCSSHAMRILCLMLMYASVEMNLSQSLSQGFLYSNLFSGSSPPKKKIISPPLFVGKLVVKVHVEKGHPTYTIFIEEQVQNYITYITCGISIHTCIHMTCQATSPCSSFFYPQLWNK